MGIGLIKFLNFSISILFTPPPSYRYIVIKSILALNCFPLNPTSDVYNDVSTLHMESSESEAVHGESVMGEKEGRGRGYG